MMNERIQNALRERGFEVSKFEANTHLEGIVLGVASDLQVDVFSITKDPRPLEALPRIRFFSIGPDLSTFTGHGLVIVTSPPVDWKMLLHEVGHAVWTPPGRSPDDEPLNECDGMDPWLAQIIKERFPRRVRKEWRNFENESTRAFGNSWDCSSYYNECRRLAGWRRAKKNAEKLGMIVNGRAAMRKPDYSALESVANEMAKLCPTWRNARARAR